MTDNERGIVGVIDNEQDIINMLSENQSEAKFAAQVIKRYKEFILCRLEKENDIFITGGFVPKVVFEEYDGPMFGHGLKYSKRIIERG